MKGYLVLLLATIVAVASATEVGYARLIGGNNDPAIVGDVYFVTLNSSYTWVWANVSGITQYLGNSHGLHVHQYGDLTDRASFLSVGSHFAGAGSSTTHACEDTDVRHEGDMGNWQVNSDGTILQDKTLDLLALSGTYSIIGKAVVLHNFTDDCATVPSSGARLASGVIGVANLTNLPTAVWDALADNTTNPAASGDSSITKAVAYLTPISGSSVYGVVTLQQLDSNTVLVQANISGLTSGSAYGFHIHTYGDLKSTNGLATGSHYNPYSAPHGIPPNSSRHVGDMGNICSASGSFFYYNYTFTDDLLSLEDASNVLGRTIIVHAQRDDGGSVYGTRIAQGVIGVGSIGFSNVTFPAGINITEPLCPVSSTTSGTTTATTTTSADTTSTGATSATTSSSSASSIYAGIFALFLVFAILF